MTSSTDPSKSYPLTDEVKQALAITQRGCEELQNNNTSFYIDYVAGDAEVWNENSEALVKAWGEETEAEASRLC